MTAKQSPHAQLELLLQIAMATMTALGTLMLGMGERDLTLPVLAMIVSATSVFVTDVGGYLRLNARVANIAGSTAVVVFVWDFLHRFSGDTQLLAVANLLIYLQFILLYQRKTITIYWLLALLSLLQTAVATVLNFEILFGFLLLAYFICGVLTLGLFFLYRETTRYAPATSEHEGEAMLAASPVRAITTPAGVSDEQTSDPLSWVFVRQMTLASTIALSFAIAFFFIMPRLGQRNWRQPILAGQPMLGASEKIVLGELGQISESPLEVMKVEFLEADTGRPYLLGEAPLFRGVCLTRYEHNAWRQDSSGDDSPDPLERHSPVRGLVRQVIHMAPSESSVVYCVAPVLAASGGLAVQHDKNSWRLDRVDPYTDTLQLDTSGFIDRRQSRFIPQEANETPDLFDEDSKRLTDLSSLAATIVNPIDPEDTLARARELTNHLHNSGDYAYTLSPPTRPAGQDAIEDFLFKQKRGHCEYFASALALMLRSVGIHSRVVIGFNGGEWNPWGRFYLVRELHAHAWVEAWLPADKLPAHLRDRDPEKWRNGGWVTLDPTPGAEGSLARLGTPAGQPSLRQAIEYARYLWANYVMGLNADKQLRAIYEPLLGVVSDTIRAAFSRETWSQVGLGLYEWVGLGEWERTRRIPWRLGVLILLAALALSWAAWQWRKPRQRRIQSWLSRWAIARHQRVIVDFYDKLETLLARHQNPRPEQLTQLEFAKEARDWLAASAETSAVAQVPVDITQVFYRVRFGGSPLDSAERKLVEQSLAQLSTALAARR